MVLRRQLVFYSVILVGLLLAAQSAGATSYSLTVATDSSAYYVGQTITVSGSVSPAPGPSTGVALKVINPSGTVVAVGEAEVGSTSGLYNYTFVAGGTSSWTAGTYSVNATWGAYPPQIYAQAQFSYSPTAPTTTTTTTSSTTTTPTTSITTTTTTTSSTSTTSTTTTSTSKGGGISVFPFEGTVTAIFVVLILSAYFLARKFVMGGPRLQAR